MSSLHNGDFRDFHDLRKFCFSCGIVLRAMDTLATPAVVTGAKDAGGRNCLQNYESLPLFLPGSVWRQVMSAQLPGAGALRVVQALGALVAFLVRMGLRYPSEPTFARIFVVMRCRVGFPGMSEDQIHAAYLVMKGQVRAAISREDSRAADLPMYLELPATPALLTAEQRDVLYGQDPLPQDLPVSLNTMNILQVSVKLRKRGSDVEKAKTSSEAVQVLAAALGAVVSSSSPAPGPLQTRSSQQLLALEDAPREPAKADTPRAMEAAAPASVPLALAAEPHAVAPPPSAVAAMAVLDSQPAVTEEETAAAYEESAVLAATTSSALLTAARSISQAMDARDGQRAVDAGKPVPKSLDDAFAARVKKKPASSSLAPEESAPSQAAAMKKPSGAQKPAAKKPAAVKKKAAAAKKPAAAEQTLKRSAAAKGRGREQVLACVPDKLKRKFSNGCSTCRYRPGCCTSCWVKRGF